MPTAEQAYQMLDNETLWEVACQCHEALERAGLAHALAGGVAVCLHGYQRNTVDVDLLVRGEDADEIRRVLGEISYVWSAEFHEFRSGSGIPVQFLLAGDPAGDDGVVTLPDPADARIVSRREGLPVLSLAKLIETKIACGLGNPRRTHKDFADVVELIVIHDLSRSFARHLHKSLRETFRRLVLQARGESG